MKREEIEDGMGFSGLVPSIAERNEERRLKQMDVNFKFVMNAIDQIHENLCPGQFGTWQDRVKQSIEASKNWCLAKEDADRYAFSKTLEGQVVTIKTFRLGGAAELDKALDAAMAELR
jgi:hypothetical protein